MALTAELVIESDRTAFLRAPGADSSEVTVLNPKQSMSGRIEAYSLTPDEFYEVGPILRTLGVRTTERKLSIWENLRDLVRPPSKSTTRTVVLASH